MQKKGSSNIKTVSLLFSAVAFVTGFLLIDRGSISGNVIIGSGSTIGTISVVGLFFVLAAVFLAVYGIRR